MAIFDELEGVLGAEVIAKFPPELRAKVEFGDRLNDYYEGKTNEVPERQPARGAQPTQQVVTPPAGNFGASLDDIEKLFDKRLGNISESVAKQVNEIVEQRGAELTGTAIAVSLRNTRELMRAESRHQADFGEALDEDKFNTFVNSSKDKGVNFNTVSEAYDAFTRERYTEKKIADGVREGLKHQQSSSSLPGVSPVASRGPVAILQSRRANEGGGGGETAVTRAARALQERQIAAQNI